MSFNQKIGILGGGQLGRMLCEAASPMDLDLHILDKDVSFPAGRIAPAFHLGDFTNYDDVVSFGKDMDVVSIEIEKVSLEGLVELENLGKRTIPSSHVLRIIRDKGLQKEFYAEHDFQTASFSLHEDKRSIWDAILSGDIEYPFVQKARRDGYDGRGVAVIRDEEDLPKLMDVPSVIEELVDIKKELAVTVARNEKGELTTFPVVEMEFDAEANLVNILRCPAQIPAEVEVKATKLVLALAEAIQLTGLLAVELFIDNDNSLWVNESAPRPHNSGHHTIEGCNYSQYDIHIRCLLNQSLPKIKITSPSGMFNLLGEAGHTGSPKIKNIDTLMGMPEAYLHWYGKKETRAMRKMGHVTVLGKDIAEVDDKLAILNTAIKVIS